MSMEYLDRAGKSTSYVRLILHRSAKRLQAFGKDRRLPIVNRYRPV